MGITFSVSPIPDTLAKALDAYIHDQETLLSATDFMQATLAQFLPEQGYLPSLKKHLQITPSASGSGYINTSVNHDSALVKQMLEP